METTANKCPTTSASPDAALTVETKKQVTQQDKIRSPTDTIVSPISKQLARRRRGSDGVVAPLNLTSKIENMQQH